MRGTRSSRSKISCWCSFELSGSHGLRRCWGKGSQIDNSVCTRGCRTAYEAKWVRRLLAWRNFFKYARSCEMTNNAHCASLSKSPCWYLFGMELTGKILARFCCAGDVLNGNWCTRICCKYIEEFDTYGNPHHRQIDWLIGQNRSFVSVVLGEVSPRNKAFAERMVQVPLSSEPCPSRQVVGIALGQTGLGQPQN